MNKILTMLTIYAASAVLMGMPLSIDSVTVDSVWNSDSAGADRRDCRVRFLPMGNMKSVWCIRGLLTKREKSYAKELKTVKLS